MVDGFLPIEPEEAVTLAEQQERYDAWRASLPTAMEPQELRRSRARQALDESNAAIIANREAATLARGDLPPDKGNAS
jgi:hypothetical protein